MALAVNLDPLKNPDDPKVTPEEVKAKASGYQLHHMALELPEEAFDAQHAAFVTAGMKPRGGKHPVLASRTMYVDDPDGNEVEFICRAPAS